MVPQYAEALSRCAESGSTRATPMISTSTSAPRLSAPRWLRPGVPDEVIRFELFDGTHSGIDYRYPMALGWLCERIS